MSALLQRTPGKLVRDKGGVQGTAVAKSDIAGMGTRNGTGCAGWWHEGTFTHGGLT